MNSIIVYFYGDMYDSEDREWLVDNIVKQINESGKAGGKFEVDEVSKKVFFTLDSEAYDYLWYHSPKYNETALVIAKDLDNPDFGKEYCRCYDWDNEIHVKPNEL